MKLSREMLEKAVEIYSKGPGRKFVPVRELGEKQLANAIKHCDKYSKPEEVVAFLDTTLFANGKDGILLTEQKIVCSDGVSNAAYLENLVNAECSGDEVKVWLSENSYRKMKIKTYAKETASLLNAIAKLKLLAEKSELEKEETELEKLEESKKTEEAKAKAEPLAKKEPAVKIKEPEKTDEELFTEAGVYYTEKRFKEAFALYEKLADKGNATAQNNCGIMYYSGTGVELSREKAFYWFEKAARNGSASSAYNLAVMYNTGETVKEDKKTAFLWFEKSAERGYAPGQYVCGKAYIYGNETKQDYDKAVFWLEKAADQGNNDAAKTLRTLKQSLKEEAERKEAEEKAKREAEAFRVPDYDKEKLYYYAKELQDSGREKEAFECCKKAAEMGYADACYDLGQMYYVGDGTKIDCEKAFEWFKKAAEKADTDAMCKCAEIILCGHIGGGREREAVDFLDVAVSKGSVRAKELESRFFLVCDKIHKEDMEAADRAEIRAITDKMEERRHDKDEYTRCYEKAIEGDSGFMLRTADICEKIGSDINSDEKLKEAFFWAALAAEEGNHAAMKKLGKMFEEGIGVPIYFGKALEWYKKTPVAKYESDKMESDLKEGYLDLVPDPDWIEDFVNDCLFIGEGRYELAFSFDEKFEGLVNLFIAAEFDEPNAQYYLGEIYCNGFIFIKPNLEKAKYWLEKARKNGAGEAIEEEALELLIKIR